MLLAIHPKISQIAAPFTSMLKTSGSTKSTTRPGKGGVGVGVDGGNDSDAIGKSVKKSTKSRRIIKEFKSFKGLKILQTPSVWKNVYRSTDPLSTRYEELKRSDSFLSTFAETRSSLDTRFGAITDKAQLME